VEDLLATPDPREKAAFAPPPMVVVVVVGEQVEVMHIFSYLDPVVHLHGQRHIVRDLEVRPFAKMVKP
jgi:hypothetical protein